MSLHVLCLATLPAASHVGLDPGKHRLTQTPPTPLASRALVTCPMDTLALAPVLGDPTSVTFTLLIDSVPL